MGLFFFFFDIKTLLSEFDFDYVMGIERNIDPKLCMRCKGKLLCGLSFCPIFAQNDIQREIRSKIKIPKDGNLNTHTNGVFIGSQNFPDLSVGFLGSFKENPTPSSKLYKLNMTDVIKERVHNLRNFKPMNIKKVDMENRFIHELQDISMAKNNIENDVKSNKIVNKSSFSIIEAPYGPKAQIEKLKIEENPKIPTKMYKIIEDKDQLSKNAVGYLYKNGFEKDYIENVFSAGTTGLKKNRSLVPTRWSITATDDIISKFHIDKLRDNKQDNPYLGFYSEQYGNHFFVLMIPTSYKFEIAEIVQPGSVYNNSDKSFVMSDFEDFEGRKKYANNVTGGYYAARLPITEYQIKNRIQMSTLVLRVITKDYTTPLGVWIIREGVKKAMNNKFEFDTEERLVKFMSTLMKFKVGENINEYVKGSNIFSNKLRQSSLREF